MRRSAVHRLGMFGLLALACVVGAAAEQAEPTSLAGLERVMVTTPARAIDDFELVTDSGQPMRLSALRGRPLMLFFGYTHCPDVCPLTMTDMHVALTKLGPLAKDVRILFVTVDPARDTPAVLHKYVKSFDKRAIGLTGSEQQIKALAGRYHLGHQMARG